MAALTFLFALAAGVGAVVSFSGGNSAAGGGLGLISLILGTAWACALGIEDEA